jgi:hypothetical protein
MKKQILLAVSMLLLACSPGSGDAASVTPVNPCNLEAPVPTAQSQNIYAAETLELSVQDIIYANYLWTGPNGFTSGDREPKIRFTSTAMSGVYQVKYGKNACESETKTIQINIVAPTPPCNTANNTMTTNVYGNRTFSYLAGNNNAGNYEFTANGTGADLNFEFSTTTKPVAGLYKIVDSFSLTQQNEVRVGGVISNNYVVPTSGVVYVSFDGSGKMNIKYCSLTFTNPSGYISNFVSSANLTEI